MLNAAPTCRITIDGHAAVVAPGITVAAALANAGQLGLRRSVVGEVRGVLCGMGVCQECRVTIDGAPHRRACMVTVVDGMTIDRGEARA